MTPVTAVPSIRFGQRDYVRYSDELQGRPEFQAIKDKLDDYRNYRLLQALHEAGVPLRLSIARPVKDYFGDGKDGKVLIKMEGPVPREKGYGHWLCGIDEPDKLANSLTVMGIKQLAKMRDAALATTRDARKLLERAANQATGNPDVWPEPSEDADD